MYKYKNTQVYRHFSSLFSIEHYRGFEECVGAKKKLMGSAVLSLCKIFYLFKKRSKLVLGGTNFTKSSDCADIRRRVRNKSPKPDTIAWQLVRSRNISKTNGIPYVGLPKSDNAISRDKKTTHISFALIYSFVDGTLNTLVRSNVTSSRKLRSSNKVYMTRCRRVCSKRTSPAIDFRKTLLHTFSTRLYSRNEL